MKSDRRRVIAIIVTFRRPLVVLETIRRVMTQTVAPDEIWVVDNDPTTQLAEHIETLPNARYVAMPHNSGPAGGIAAGMHRVLVDAGDDDWILLIDDDDPPPFPDVIERLLAAIDAADADLEQSGGTKLDGKQLGGIGMMGARFDRRTSHLRRLADDELTGLARVDYIGGNQLPMYRAAAVRQVGPFDASMFFGYDDLEFGLRLAAAGWALCIPGELATAVRVAAGRHGHAPATSDAPEQPAWRRFHSTRNLVRIARVHGGRVAAIRVALTFGVGGFLRLAARQRSLRSGLPALRGAWFGLVDRNDDAMRPT